MLLSHFGRGSTIRRPPGIVALLLLSLLLVFASGYLLLAPRPRPPAETLADLAEAGTLAQRVAPGPRSEAPVTVVADGRDVEVPVGPGATVGVVLDRLNLAVDQDDRVTPSLTSPVTDGAEIVVQRVSTTVEVRQVVVPPPLEERRTTDLPEGSRREVSEGQEGTTHVIEEVTWVDGVATERVRTEERVIAEPEPRIVEVGTAAQDTGDVLEDLGEVASSALEDIQTGGASWYVFGDELTAAHKTLPKGTMVTVTNLANGKSVQVRINDRGPFIPGRVIDLNKVAFEQIASPSQGVIDVSLSW